MSQLTLRQYENIVVLKGENETGSKSQSIQVVSGARLIVGLSVTSLDLGAGVTVNIKNGFQSTDLSTIGSLVAAATGKHKGVFTDFHNQFEFEVVVTGGNATYAVGITVHDNAATTTIENAEVQVALSDRDTGTGRFDSVRIGDGDEYLDIIDGGIKAQFQEAENIKIVNHLVAAANTEFSLSLMPNTVDFKIKVRDSASRLKVAFVEDGTTTSEYITIERGCSERFGRIKFGNASLVYLSSDKAGVVIELMNWYY